MSTVRPLEIVVEAKSRGNVQKLNDALAELAAADLDFGVSLDAESGQTLLSGTSEEHLDAKIETLRRSYNIDVNVGPPQVAYRETLAWPARIDHTHKKLTGAVGEFARVIIDFAPGAPGSGFLFENKAALAPGDFVRGVEDGLEIGRRCGLLAGFPVIDFTAGLVDCVYHEADSSAFAFQIAAQAAFRELRDKAGIRLLEPIMKVQVVTPDEFAGAVIDDLKSRRGLILDRHSRGDAVIVNAMAPLGNMFGYANTLPSFTGDVANYTMTFDHYEAVPLPDDDPRFPPAVGMRAI